MKNKKLLFGVFIVVAVLQAAMPLYMAWRWENILATGQRFYWQTAPVDPYDVFKGRYVALRFEETTAPVVDEEVRSGKKAYAIIEENAAGQAFISAVTAKRPEQGAYVTAKIYRSGEGMAYVVLPFTRYYMNEYLAPAAEAAYRESAGKSGVAAVRIKDGYGVIEELYIGDKTLVEFLRQP